MADAGTNTFSIEDLQALATGIDQVLAKIESTLALEVYAEDIPIVGDELKAAFDQGTEALHTIQTLKNAITGAIHELANAQTYLETAVEAKINEAMAQAGFIGAAVDAIINGGQVTLAFTTDKVLTYSQSLAADFGLAGLGLNAQTAGEATAEISYSFDFTVGVDGTTPDSFFLQTNGGSPELALGLSVTTPGLAADATLGFLNFAAVDQGSSLTGSFAVDIKDADGKLRLSELGNDMLDAKFSGNANLDLHLSTDMGDAALPKMSADLAVDWAFSSNIVDPNDTNSNFGGAPTVAFNNVRYDFGTFVEDFIRPILDQLDPVLQPIHQALAVFKTDLTFLKIVPEWQSLLDKAGATEGGHDVGDGKITLIDFVKLANPSLDLGSTLQFIKLVDDIVEWAEFFQGKNFGADQYDLGSFQILADIRDAAFEMSKVVPTVTAAAADLSGFLGGLTLGGFSEQDPQTGETGQQILQDMFSGTSFAFPILTNPMEAFKLLLGGNANLFSLDLPALDIGFGDFDSYGNPTGNLVDLGIFPIIPGINVKFAGALELAIDMAFGYDTRGLLQFVESGFQDYTSIFNGFYVSDQVANGVDLPELSLSAAVELAIEASIYLASVGGGGNIAGQIFLNLNDDVNGSPEDGRIYLDEMANALLTNPFAIFDASGQITAGFAAYVNVAGWDVWRYNSPRIVVGSFTFSDNPVADVEGAPPPPPPGLGDIIDGNLVLNIGDRAGERDIADKTDGYESVQIGSGPGGVTVVGFGHTEHLGDVSGIVGNGDAQDDSIVLAEDLNIAATLSGGDGGDILYGGAAGDSISGDAGRDFLEGRDGADTLLGGEGNDVLTGGAGADVLDGGNGLDIASYATSLDGVDIDLAAEQSHGGDAEGDTYASIEIIEGSRSADTMSGASGVDIFVGLDGNDNLAGRDNNDVLVGGYGSDTLDGGAGDDVLYGGLGDDLYLVDSLSDVVDENGDGQAGGRDRIVASIDYSLLGSSERADIEELELTGSARLGIGNALDNLIIGTEGNDTLDGAGGADELRGGAGDDTYVFDSMGDRVVETANGGIDQIILKTGALVNGTTFSLDTSWSASVENVALADHLRAINLTGNALDNSLTGNDANNALSGLDGNDTLAGGRGVDTVGGGDGIDTLVIDYSQVNDGYGAWMGRGDSIETYWWTTRTEFTSIERFSITGTLAHGNDVHGGALDDTLIGGNADDILDTRSGINEVVDGKAGNDRWLADLSTAETAIVFSAADSQNATIVLSNGTRVGNIEALTLKTGTSDDEISTDVYWLNDTVQTGAGDDTVNTGRGVDSVDGGDGIDTLVVDYSMVNDGYGAWMGRGSNIETYWWSTRIDYTGIERFDVTGTLLRGNDLHGGSLDDTLIGGNADDTLDTRSGTNEVVDGKGGNDRWVADLSDASTDITFSAQNSQNATTVLTNGTKVSNIEALTLKTGSGNDEISTDGYWLNDSVQTGAGDDTVNTGRGVDAVDGGDGIDTLVVDYSMVDDAYGASMTRGDLIETYWWSNRVDFTGIERFDVTGTLTHGNDLHGGALDDTLIGGDADDKLDTRTGINEVVDGKAGNDRWVADLSDVNTAIVFSAAGSQNAATLLSNGTQVSNVEALTLKTGSGNDEISTNDYWLNDSVQTGAGDDTVNTGRGVDSVDGGTGIDTLIVDYSMIDEGYGAVLNGSSLIQTYWWANRIDFLGIERFDVTGTLRYSNDLTGGLLSDTLIGGNANDTLNTRSGSNEVVDGGAGDDRWQADLSDVATAVVFSAVDSQTGPVVLSNGTQVTHIEGLTLTTGTGDDFISTATYGMNDVIATDAGNDTINAGAGVDSVDGGSGEDTLVLDYSGVNDGYGASLNGAIGSVMTYWWSTRVDFSGIEHLDVTGTLTHSNNLTGGHLSDTLTGGNMDDRVDGADGDDLLVGGAGLDVIRGGAGADTLDGGSEADLLIGGDGADHLVGGVGTDTASYQDADAGVTADLGTPSNNVGDAAGDTYDSIEVLLGSAYDDLLRGDTADNILSGSEGNDTLEGGVGADTLDGGYGDDTASYTHAASGIVLDLSDASRNTGEAQNDVLIGIENVVGTDFADILMGNSSSNRLDGGAGDDVLEGRWGWGYDTLVGGAGSDTASYENEAYGVTADLTNVIGASDYVYSQSVFDGVENLRGSAFDDTLRGDGGANLLEGQAGDDVLEGRGGGDLLVGSAGSDTASYGSAADGVVADLADATRNTGEAAGDSYDSIENLTGSTYDDDLRGDARANVLSGGAGDDTLQGGDGNDTLIGDEGADLLEGGDGADHFVGDWGGADTVSYEHAAMGVSVDLADTAANTGEAAGDTFLSVYNLRGSAHDDVLRGDADFYWYWGGTANVLDGGDGDDILEGRGGADTLIGGTGSDTASYAHAGMDWAGLGVIADLGDPSQNTGEAEGDVYTSIENLTGSAYTDVLRGDAGRNVLDGGAGDDILESRGGGDSLLGSDGSDTASYAGAAGSVTVDLADASLNSGDALGDTYDSIENVAGSLFSDTLSGNSGDNGLTGGEGNDILEGRAGNDVLSGDAGDDTLYGGDGNDSLDGGNGHNLLVGGAGDDTLMAGAGGSILIGGDGADVLQGSWEAIDTASYQDAADGIVADLADSYLNTSGAAGDSYASIENLIGSAHDDILRGDYGDNILASGAGDDVLAGGYGADTLVGGEGTDTADYQNSFSFYDGLIADLADTSRNTGDASGDVYDGIENLTGTYGSDALGGDAGDNVLDGSDGDDTLEGRSGADTLVGGYGLDTASYAFAGSGIVADLSGQSLNEGDAQDDVYVSIENLTGSTYDDILRGDADANVLDGGAGADILEGNGGDDVILGGAGADQLDGEEGSDTLSYAGSSAAVAVNLTTRSASGGDAIGDVFTNFENIAGSSWNDTLTGDQSSNVLYGAAGNDTLDGRAGADILYGDAGNDTYFVDDAFDLVIESARQGTDTVYASTSYALSASAEVEVLRTTNTSATTAINLTGSSTANIILGNAGANRLDGKMGADTLYGYGGNDIYYVDSALDQVIEAAGYGTDTVYASTSHVLGASASVETLSTISASATTTINLTGNSIANTLIGNAGANYLTGKAGNDVLTGGKGKDTFVFDTTLSATANVDTVRDFVAADDTIRLENAVFRGLKTTGTLAKGALQLGKVAKEADDRILYDKSTGYLYYDQDGSGTTYKATLFAKLTTKPTLTYADFYVI
ncbi:hypothetical protein [Microvirga sp. G4-2]|uniref:hypothetical protein n=1 Tax=Microvirga sp. G4-2 TaxID=3434467 RepID=UPI004044D3D4